ncbi:MAG TPA: prephenate/arogenate dehydrogenase [Synechococcales cyanobacterium M55_K2018_004]|nr:prephenate/arogenate dehydrogenase [Synechococcales cyanobacterium M55_K2018_004]
MEVGIVGLGLIGGSLAIDLRSLGHRVVGVGRRVETCELAIARGMVDEASPDLASLAGADVVFLCTPLGVMEATVRELVPHLKDSAILTDVGSVKQPVVEAIAPLWRNFVGGHPMAGTAESGLEAALAGLFVNRPYVLTPVASTSAEAIAVVGDMVRSLQATLYQCQPAVHDRAVAWISHLPVMVSASLMKACLQESDPIVLELAQQLASSGFRDTSRVGGGNPELGVMMAKYNQTALLESLKVYRQVCDHVIGLIEQSRWHDLEAILQQTQQARPSYLRSETER